MAEIPAEGEGVDAPASSNFSFNLLTTAWKHKSLVLFGSLVGVVLAVLYYVEKPAVYQSTAQIMIHRRQLSQMTMQGVAMRQMVYYDYVSAHGAVLKSPMLVDMAVKKFNLNDLDSFKGGYANGQILANFTVTANSSTNTQTLIPILLLSYRGANSQDCETVLNAMHKEFKEWLEEKYKDTNKDTKLKLEKYARELQTEFNDLMEKKRQLDIAQLDLPRTTEGTALQDPIIALDIKLLDRNDRLRTLKDQLDGIERAVRDNEDPTPLVEQALDLAKNFVEDSRKETREEITGLRTQLSLLEQEGFRLQLQGIGTDHPDWRILEKKKQLVEERVRNAQGGATPQIQRRKATKQEVTECIANINREMEKLNKDMAALQKQRVEEQRIARQVREFNTTYNANREKIEQNKKAMESNSVALAQIGAVQSEEAYNVELLHPPGPGYKVEPRGSIIIPMGLLFGVLAGVGLAYLADWSDCSFRSPTEIRRRLGLNILGHIPAFNIEGDPSPEMVGLDTSLCTAHRTKSSESEAFRGVRTSLFFAMQGAGHRVIQVTSPSMGDGKSTLAANLAISVAQSGKSVLLIDADCRRPRQHRLFSLQTQTGVASVLLGETEPMDAVQKTPVPNLSIMPCGPKPPNPAELLSSPRFTELLDMMQARYDIVIVDTPPLLAVSDPCVVASRVDGVLLAIRLSKNGRPQAERAKEILASLNANVLGVVVNGLSRKGQEGYEGYNYGYGYGYNYSYGYGYGYGYEYTYNYAYDTAYTQEADSEPEMNLDGESAAGYPDGGNAAASESKGPRSDRPNRVRTRSASNRGAKKKGLLGWIGRLWG